MYSTPEQDSKAWMDRTQALADTLKTQQENTMTDKNVILHTPGQSHYVELDQAGAELLIEGIEDQLQSTLRGLEDSAVALSRRMSALNFEGADLHVDVINAIDDVHEMAEAARTLSTTLRGLELMLYGKSDIYDDAEHDFGDES